MPPPAERPLQRPRAARRGVARGLRDSPPPAGSSPCTASSRTWGDARASSFKGSLVADAASAHVDWHTSLAHLPSSGGGDARSPFATRKGPPNSKCPPRSGLQAPECSAAEEVCNMAAPRSRSSSSSSSSEETEETLARLREAAWDPARQSGAALQSPTAEHISQERQVPAAESSTRTKVHDQCQDANELQTTPEFRAHVAKKLEAILDSSITTLEYPLQTTQKNQKASESENDGFRLFSSSLPGDCGTQEVLAAGKRRPQASSSSELDSDQEWQRFQEAAVTVADILQQSGLPGVLQGCGRELSRQADEPSRKKSKKKKKKKQKAAEVEEEDSGEEGAVETARRPLNGAHMTGGNVETGEKKKKKKKKKTAEARTE